MSRRLAFLAVVSRRRAGPALLAMGALACSPSAPATSPPASSSAPSAPSSGVAPSSAPSARARGPQCPAPASIPVEMALGGACATDQDCSGPPRLHPRCAHTPTWVGPGKPKPGPMVRACVVDGCADDGDCPSGELCFCGAGVAGTNRCAPSACKVDGDCTAGQTCEVEPGPAGPQPSITYGLPYRRCR